MDIDFNVNVIIGLDGVICGVFGGYFDISMVCKMSLVIVLFVCGWILIIVE